MITLSALERGEVAVTAGTTAEPRWRSPNFRCLLMALAHEASATAERPLARGVG